MALIAAFRRLKQLGPRQRSHQPLLAAHKAPGSVGGLLLSLASRLSKCGFQQASRITLTESYRRNNSYGDDFAHHLGRTGVSKLFKDRVQSFARRCFRVECHRSHG